MHFEISIFISCNRNNYSINSLLWLHVRTYFIHTILYNVIIYNFIKYIIYFLGNKAMMFLKGLHGPLY